ncbi:MULTISPECIES: RNase adapter RapZ [Fusobacterium]|uniref:RNase adapter RapZ n=1 Tax=Fusobacterium TaxID=848 RepID=UPI001F24A782|nr:MULTISPECIES: RNase adapter RapZ [Fusobacterium]MCF2612592.1 RNase adapter RapZ [Fusobacterium perfoetens]MDY2980139.1 RNase adapter RapZ [Fusobacterium sp.]
MKIIIVTGISGAGKTTALNILEDSGYVTMDNLLCSMVVFLLQNLNKEDSTLKIDKLALGIDNRTIHTSEEFAMIYNCLKDINVDFEIIYLDSSDEALLKRYNLTRRRHPVRGNTLLESIQKEKLFMSEMKDKSTYVIDTSETNTKELREEILNIINNSDASRISVHIESFGFKYGIPIDKDLIFDVRVLPNPYYIDELKNKTGNDKEVYEYVMGFEESEKLYQKIYDMVKFMLPLYKKDNKQHLSIGIGCSGGQHRSVAFVNRLAEDLGNNKKIKVLKKHREGDKSHWT